MYTKKYIIDKLAESKYFVDEETLEKYLKSWKIDAIYEDDNKEEFFDDHAIEKIIKGMELKTTGENDRRISYELSKEIQEEKRPIKFKPTIHNGDLNNNKEAKLKKFTLDITNHTVSFLADSIAQKITTDITDHLKETDFLQSAIETGSLKRDNEILAKQIEVLIQEKDSLKQELVKEQQEKLKYKPVFGNFYIKIE